MTGAGGPADPFDEIVAGLSAPSGIALIITPVPSARLLGKFLEKAGLSGTVIGARSGAVLAKELPPQDPFEQLQGSLPAEPLAIAKAISILTKLELILMVARFDESFEGKVSAWKIHGEDVTGEIAPGLVLAKMDHHIEDLITGVVRLEDLGK